MSSAEPQIYLFYTVFVNPILITQYIAIFIPSEPEFFFLYILDICQAFWATIFILYFSSIQSPAVLHTYSAFVNPPDPILFLL